MTRRMAVLSMGRQGQALAELGLFGAVLLIALGAILRFGLQYIYQLQADHQAFRLSLYTANNRSGAYERNNPLGQGNASVLNDRYIPDPTQPFAIGQRSAVQSGTGVSWGNRSSDVPDILNVDPDDPDLDTDELFLNSGDETPRINFMINGTSVNEIEYQGQRIPLTAGKYLAYFVPSGRFDDYVHIFLGDGDFDPSDAEEARNARQALRYRRRQVLFEDGTPLVALRNGRKVPLVGPPDRAWMYGPVEDTRIRTVIVFEECAGPILGDPSSCARRCSRLQRIYSQANQDNAIIPPYCGERVNPDGTITPVAEPLNPDQPWRRQLWRWSRLPGGFQPQGPDLSQMTRRKDLTLSWRSLGSPQDQEITKRGNAEDFTERMFSFRNCGDDVHHGDYALIRNVSIDSLRDPMGRRPQQRFPLPGNENEIWTTP